MIKQRLLFIVNNVDFFLSHRVPIAIAALKDGYEIHVAAPDTLSSIKIKNLGFIFHPIYLSRSGMNPVQELKSIWSIYRLIKEIEPNVIHLVTIKPVIYGGIVGRLAKVPAVVLAIPGMGFIFTSTSLFARLCRPIIMAFYRFIFKHPKIKCIFQNPDDKQFFINNKLCLNSQTSLILGSGVNLNEYIFTPEPNGNEIVIGMISRLLKDKGVVEFIEAAKILKTQYANVKFVLVGDIDYGNPAFVEKQLLDKWKSENFVEILGFRKDISTVMSTMNIIVLPSYREGLPKVLIEAAACGRAVVTCDVPGCRTAIKPDETGLLVPAKNSHALAMAIKKLIDDPTSRVNMGAKGRLFAEQTFCIEKVVNEHLTIYEEVLSQ